MCGPVLTGPFFTGGEFMILYSDPKLLYYFLKSMLGKLASDHLCEM